DYQFTPTDQGRHQFPGVVLKTAGQQSLTATDTAHSAVQGKRANLTVKPAAASVLVVSGYPSPTPHGVAQTFTVTVQDAYGNTATGYRGTVHFSSSDSLAALPADYTFTGTDAGIHSFTATFNTVGTQSLTALDTTTATLTGTQTGIQVTA